MRQHYVAISIMFRITLIVEQTSLVGMREVSRVFRLSFNDLASPVTLLKSLGRLEGLSIGSI